MKIYRNKLFIVNNACPNNTNANGLLGAFWHGAVQPPYVPFLAPISKCQFPYTDRFRSTRRFIDKI